MCSITGYGQDGPVASRAGHELDYMATAGGLGLNGELEGPSIPLAVQVADIGGGGLQPAVAILGALMGGQRGGEGRWIDASMTDGAVTWLGMAFAARDAGESVLRGDQRLAGRYACYRVYACEDGGLFSGAGPRAEIPPPRRAQRRGLRGCRPRPETDRGIAPGGCHLAASSAHSLSTCSRVTSRLPLLSMICFARARLSSMGICEAMTARALSSLKPRPSTNRCT